MSNAPNPNRMVVKKVDGEWQVRVYENGKYNEDKSYFAMDKQDAEDTMRQMKTSEGGRFGALPAVAKTPLAFGAGALLGALGMHLLMKDGKH